MMVNIVSKKYLPRFVICIYSCIYYTHHKMLKLNEAILLELFVDWLQQVQTNLHTIIKHDTYYILI